MKRYVNYWDEDGYPEREGHLEEYVEDWEDEDEEWEHQYSPVQGNWDPRDFEDEDNFQRINRRSRAVKMNEEARIRNKKKEKARRQKQAKAEEKQRKKYYHYDND